MVVPEESVRASEQGFVVFIPEEKPGADGKTQWVARQRMVQLGFRRPGSVEVLSGVEAGQRVVTRGSESLENGTPIEFTPAAKPVTATASAQLEKP
jgi:membrane fusion protein (multidrug efflux system)